MKIGKKLMSWDTYQIAADEAKFRYEEYMEDPENQIEEGLSEEDFFERIQDSHVFDVAWEYLAEHLSEVMQKKNPDGYWHCEVKNFGWRSLDGYKYFFAETGIEFLGAILPETECTFHIYNYGRGLAIQNSHHDSPCGSEYYYIKPIAESTYDKRTS